MQEQSCPLRASAVLDEAFLENRARLLEVAAFLDRIDRSGTPDEARADFRYRALRDALEILTRTTEGRTRELLLRFSDPTSEPLESARGLKGACGAWKRGER
jgi:hypothetical protein